MVPARRVAFLLRKDPRTEFINGYFRREFASKDMKIGKGSYDDDEEN
jgi:hypothetical protein